MAYLKLAPVFNGLRADPRFQGVLRRVGVKEVKSMRFLHARVGRI